MDSPPIPARQIGRYRVERILGQGGFGVVYLARDEQLQRLVAIKVPHRQRVASPADAAAYLTEARTVAGLDHPNIVPVHDVGATEECPCFIVSKYIDGRPLSECTKDERLSHAEAAELVATIAGALQYAHGKGLVHRDIKPGNILISSNGKPFLVDFGLALNEQSAGKGVQYAGTPPYMSPEQARGEGHRVDGRSDIFSLGVVFYELLTGRRPFKGESQEELLEQITSFEPRPPRQYDDQIPRELERICLKALSKRASERYTTASDMADDLRHFPAAPDREAASRGRSSSFAPADSLSQQLGLGDRRSSVSRSTFFFADFKGYTERVRILEKVAGHQAAAEMRRKVAQYIDDAFRQLKDQISPDDYQLIDTAGDGFFFHFRQPGDVFRFADALQKITSAHNAHVSDDIAEHWFRTGAATGDVAWDGGKPVGHVVNVGSRLQSASTGGDLVIDPATFDALSPEMQQQFGPKEIIRDKHDKTYEVYRTAFGRPLSPLPKSDPGNPAKPVPGPASSDSKPLKIVPKGLRSFDAYDADFFLELLPGPRDRDGLPDSIRFWKTRIEQADADHTFSVGLIYGPSGCGKSSLVKAGLLPRLSDHVIPIYVEATSDETEARLTNGLRKRCPALAANLTLKEMLTALRTGQGLPAGKKVLIILDQFEQWLHATKEAGNKELVQALRQCDGGKVQCIIMVRDDFWMAATRFMRDLEIRLIDGQNSAAVDLFELDHARKVLMAFGRAMGRLAEKSSEHSNEQEQFLDRAVAGLSQEGKVISVRLALFAEMMKGKQWTPACLKEVGGTEGVGLAFLEETFSAAIAPPEHRYHQKAARAVLKSLLPDSGTDIKGHMRSWSELLEASGYAARPKDFCDLIRILDSELRLLTPTDPEGHEQNEPSAMQSRVTAFRRLAPSPGNPGEGRGEGNFSPDLREKTLTLPSPGIPGEGNPVGSALADAFQRRVVGAGFHHEDPANASAKADPTDVTPPSPGLRREGDSVQCDGAAEHLGAGEKYYQLAHDYLVHSMRDWLARKQKETRRGRADLLLSDRADVWNARRENRQLPSLLQCLSIRWWTRRKNWTQPQRKMMARAGRIHLLRASALALLLGLAAFTGLGIRRQVVQQQQKTQAAGLVEQLLHAETAQVPDILCQMGHCRQWSDPLLWKTSKEIAGRKDPRAQLNVHLALLSIDPGQVNYLYDRLLDAEPNEVPVLTDALAPYEDQLRERLWAIVESPLHGKERQRLRAASALAKYDDESEKWAKAGAVVVNDLVLENLIFLGQWSEVFRPVKNRLLAPLTAIYRNHQSQRTGERNLATNILADYAADQPQVLADLVMDADEKQFAILYPKLKEQSERGLPVLTGEIDRMLPADATSDAKENLAKRKANAAVALLKMNEAAKVWELLKHTPQPDTRSYLIHRLGPLGADAGTIINRLENEPDVTIRRALILSLGDFREQQLSADQRAGVTTKLKEVYRSTADPGLHAAAEWLLRNWGQDPWIKQTNEQWAADTESRKQKFATITQALNGSSTSPQWYVDGQRQTMVVIPGPVEFVMGSPPTEAGREVDERQHKTRITRTFALAAKLVTLEQFQRFDPSYQLPGKHSQLADLPVAGTSWYQAAAYCNWLSQQEGIAEDQWCYGIENAKVTKLKPNYLSLTGYRLPTEAEMEYVTRAGASTERYYGDSEELLPHYAWCSQNSQEQTWPVGTKMPNDFGCFDLHGNVWSWCQDKYSQYPTAKPTEIIEDKEGDLTIASTETRVLRGGSFYNPATDVRSACRSDSAPSTHLNRFGIRAARTIAR